MTVYFSVVGQVDRPTMAYSGQKLTRLVSTNTAPSTSRMVPASPVTVPVKYSAAKTMASTMRTILSVEPMFFFMAIEI